MAVVVETTLGDITIDLYIEERPTTCMNFLKLCKIKYYNFCLFHSVQQNFITQTGDPSGSGHGGSSIFHYTQGNNSNYYEAEKLPKIKHNNIGTVSMVNCGNNMLGSQFFITLGKDLQSLDGEHCVFGEVTEGHEILRKFNEVICDQGHRPYQDIRITHTVILEDPFDDPPGLKVPDASPELTKEVLANSRIAPDEEIDETAGLTAEEVQEMQRKREAQAQATILEIVGDLPDADIAPPENVLFVCKLNPVTTDDDLEIIFSRFGKIVSCEVIRDKNTGDSLQYAFVEFDNRKACEDAYFKMDNVLIDDRRIHVDFSQSVSKLRWKGKGRLEHLDDGKSRLDYANYDRKHDGKVGPSPESLRQRHGESDSRTHNRIPNRRENDRSSKVSRENNILRHDGRHERSNERHTRVYSESGRNRYHRSHDSRERYRSEVNRENSYRYKPKHNERERYRNERRKDVYDREDKYKKKSKSESSDSEDKVSTNEDIHTKGTRRKIQDDLDYEKVNYREKEGIKEKYDAEQNVEVKNVCRAKKHTRKSSSSSETEDESVSSSDDETRKGRDRAISKFKQQEMICEVTKTRDKTHDRRSPFEEMLPQPSVTKYEVRKRKPSGSDEERRITLEDKVSKKKVRHDHENKCEKLKKEEKPGKIKHTSNCSNEKPQTQEKHKHNRNREEIVGSSSDVVRDISRHQDKRKTRRNSSDSHESEEKSASVRSTGNNKKRERNNSTSTERRSSSCKHRSVTRGDSESDDRAPVKKSNSVKNKHDSPRRSKKNPTKTKNKKVKPTKKREIVKKKKKRRDKRNRSSSSSRTSDSETVSSSSTSGSSSSSSTSSSSSGSESSDSSSSSSSSTSSSSSDDNRRLKHRKKVSKISAVKKPKKATVPAKKTKKERRKLSDVSGEDSRKTKGKVQKKKSEMVGRNNIEKRVKVKSQSRRKKVAHSSDSSSESESSEDSIRATRKRKKIRK